MASTTKSSSLGRSNPNSRSSELTDPMRRSFSGNPFAKPSLIPNPRNSFLPSTPANTPSDSARRNSVGGREGAGGSFFCDLDDKENGKDQILKSSKVRSPAASLKNAKNFMSPTISASSKVTVSPRKKVLVERNGPARTSVSSAPDAKSPIIRKVTFAEPLQYSDLKEEGVEQKKFEALLLDEVPKEEIHVASSLGSEELSDETVFEAPFNSKNGTESSFETVADETDCVNLDPSFKLSPSPPPVSSTSTVLAPLDADPLMPPYDPKTNYLSPRPQFLHYKPKSRSELCMERELENSFMSGSFSDAEVTEDTQSECSQKESEDVSSDEIVEEEPSPARNSLAEETIEAKVVRKPRFFVRSKAIIALLLLLSAGFMSISVTNSPMIYHTVFQDFYEVYNLSDVSEFAKANFDRSSEIAKSNFDGLVQNFHTLFTKSLLSISKMISNVRGVHNLGHLQYCNLTVLHEYDAVDQGPIFGLGDMIMFETPEVYPQALNMEERDAAPEINTDEDIGNVSAMHYDSVHEEQVQLGMRVVAAVEDDSHDPQVTEEAFKDLPANVMIESNQALQLVEVSEPNHSEVEEYFSDHPNSDAEAGDIHSEEFEAGMIEAMRALEDEYSVSVDKHSNVGLKDQPGLDSDVVEIHNEAYDDNDIKLIESVSIDAAAEDNEQRLETVDFPPGMVLYLLLCGGTILMAGAAFSWSRKRKSRSTKVTSSVQQPVFAKALHANSNSLPPPKEEQSYLDKPSLRNGPTEIDMHAESCPSEMSSIQKSSSCRHKVVKELNEVHSLEKKPKKRRESLASSSDYSMGSPSYGSFTTYEKIQVKNGHGDADTITPVRRSSRIRSQATSPL